MNSKRYKIWFMYLVIKIQLDLIAFSNNIIKAHKMVFYLGLAACNRNPKRQWLRHDESLFLFLRKVWILDNSRPLWWHENIWVSRLLPDFPGCMAFIVKFQSRDRSKNHIVVPRSSVWKLGLSGTHPPPVKGMVQICYLSLPIAFC